jgi:hypothetical protein
MQPERLMGNRFSGCGRVADGIDPHAGFPQSDVAQDALDVNGPADEGADARRGLNAF